MAAMTSTLAEVYLRKGDEAVSAMEAEKDPFLRHMWDKVADHWHTLAERVDRQQSAGVGPYPEPQL